MTKRYVLTGGPSSGKSTLTRALEFLGEYVVHEAAEDMILLKQALGIKEPWDLPDFQEELLKLQFQRESRIPDVKRVFIDRGIFDGLNYKGFSTFQRLNLLHSPKRYDKVFVIAPIGHVVRTSVRKESYQECLDLYHKSGTVYSERGYEVIDVPNVGLEERVELIKNQL